jgi:hypothetical protein
MKSALRGLLAVLVLLATVSCASKRATPPPPSGEGMDSKTRAEAFQAAVKDLADKIGAPKSDVAGVSQEDVTWPDSCLGCAKTGEMCAQVLTPGYKLTLRVRDATYVYHSNRGDRVRLCDQSSLSGAPTPTPGY